MQHLAVQERLSLGTPGTNGGHDETADISSCIAIPFTRGRRDRTPNVLHAWTASYTRMGFGSYDESEQRDQTVETDGNAVNVHENDHEGAFTFENDASTDELLDKLGDIKDQ